MRVLLDTQVLLWMFARSGRLSPTARDTLSNGDNELFFSIAGYWEIGIKASLGKLRLAEGWEEVIPKEIAHNGIVWLPISPSHVHAVSQLPWPHRDPFDRIMIAQATAEELAVVTSDTVFSDYPFDVVW